MAISTATKVASAFLHLSEKRGAGVTNLKLQKYLYYAQAWFLVFNDEPLFDDALEAWVHGPVVARVFGDYKSYRWSPIGDRGTAIGIPAVEAHLEEILRVYSKFTASQLERLTHQEKPWREARGGLPLDESSRNVISHGTMKQFYSDLMNAAK